MHRKRPLIQLAMSREDLMNFFGARRRRIDTKHENRKAFAKTKAATLAAMADRRASLSKDNEVALAEYADVCWFNGKEASPPPPTGTTARLIAANGAEIAGLEVLSAQIAERTHPDDHETQHTPLQEFLIEAALYLDDEELARVLYGARWEEGIDSVRVILSRLRAEGLAWPNWPAMYAALEEDAEINGGAEPR